MLATHTRDYGWLNPGQWRKISHPLSKPSRIPKGGTPMQSERRHDTLTGASALLTDFYQLTMLDAYYQLDMCSNAVFEFFVRALPPGRNFLLAAGLEQVLEYLESLHFTADDIAWLRSLGRFSEKLLDHLQTFRFEGHVAAMSEGTVFFPGEPIVRVCAPLPQAQLVESRIINLLQFQTVVASKAVRSRLAAPYARLIDMGMRRAHGAEAAVFAARACYIAGFDSTATVAAARCFDIPIVGTMAHSFVQAHANEVDAFRHFARSQPGNVTLLLDTYDTLVAAEKVARLAPELRAQGIHVTAVRIDSGDLATQARQVRGILDRGGCRDVKILVSGGLDEYELQRLHAERAPIEAYGLGTRINVSEDAPVLDCAYKLQEYDHRPTAKRSPGKRHLPGARQVFRRYGADGVIEGDVIGRSVESLPGKALLQPVLQHGRRVRPAPKLQDIRHHVHREVSSLPIELQMLEPGKPIPVEVSPGLRALSTEVDAASR